jgi:hypothetical protein
LIVAITTAFMHLLGDIQQISLLRQWQLGRRYIVPKCNSPKCGGCYEIEPGRWIHPPNVGQKARPSEGPLKELMRAHIKQESADGKTGCGPELNKFWQLLEKRAITEE